MLVMPEKHHRWQWSRRDIRRMRKKITPIDPLYELVSISTPIKALSQIEGKTVEYVRVEQAECGTILTPYIIGGANELDQ